MTWPARRWACSGSRHIGDLCRCASVLATQGTCLGSCYADGMLRRQQHKQYVWVTRMGDMVQMVQKTAQGTPGWVLHEEGSIPCSCSPASDVLSPGFPGPTNGPRLMAGLHPLSPPFFSPQVQSGTTPWGSASSTDPALSTCPVLRCMPLLMGQGGGQITSFLLPPISLLTRPPGSTQSVPNANGVHGTAQRPSKASLLQDKDQDLDLGQEGPHTWSPATPVSPSPATGLFFPSLLGAKFLF